MRPSIPLPYFDILLGAFAKGTHDVEAAFGRHVHWGYWDSAHPADGTMRDFSLAADRMSERVADAARVRDGYRILDAGCGFGGTVAVLDERLSNARLVGLNIDPRQLDRARETVVARPRNEVSFVEGDACEMPFEDASFDAVLAVECIFHFPSRARFFAEAMRVLRPGGRLALCDVLPSPAGLALTSLKDTLFKGYVEHFLGPADLSCTVEGYRALARAAGFTVDVVEDVTRNTLPTYPVLRHIIRETRQHVLTALWGTGGMEVLSRLGLLRYAILSFAKPAETAAGDDAVPPGLAADELAAEA